MRSYQKSAQSSSAVYICSDILLSSNWETEDLAFFNWAFPIMAFLYCVLRACTEGKQAAEFSH